MLLRPKHEASSMMLLADCFLPPADSTRDPIRCVSTGRHSVSPCDPSVLFAVSQALLRAEPAMRPTSGPNIVLRFVLAIFADLAVGSVRLGSLLPACRQGFMFRQGAKALYPGAASVTAAAAHFEPGASRADHFANVLASLKC